MVLLVFGIFPISLVFGIETFALEKETADKIPQNQPESILIEELDIAPNYAILEGDTFQMRVMDYDEKALFGSVEWKSSDTSIISCSKDGKIKGLKKGKAVISVKTNIGKAQDSITVYCVEKLSNPKSSRIASPFAWTSKTPLFIDFQVFHFNMFPFFLTGELEVKGTYGSYFYVEFTRNKKQYKGFILQSWMPSNIGSNEVFRQLSRYNLDVYVGYSDDRYRVTTNYKGTLNWSVSDSSIISFDSKTGKVKGLKPGIATISATDGNKTLTCTVHSIYHWPSIWKSAARLATFVYEASGNEYIHTSTELAAGDTFTVYGDMGGNSEWAYGVSGNGTWGYVPISHISTKNTISYYNSLGWVWPVKDVKNGLTQSVKARYISSPYGWRDTSPQRHKGIDITNSISQSEGYEVVSAFAGKVIYICDDRNNDCGYCVAIRSDQKDPITGKPYVAIYMHLKYIPVVELNEDISPSQKLSCLGDTGNSDGPHLHFEVNNQSLSYGQKIYYENNPNKEMVFGSVINPLFFYMDYYNIPENNPDKIIINPSCEAMNYRKPLWYGDDIKESKNP